MSEDLFSDVEAHLMKCYPGVDISCKLCPKETLASIRKYTYSNLLKISPPKTESFQIKTSDMFYISAQNIDYWCSFELPH